MNHSSFGSKSKSLVSVLLSLYWFLFSPCFALPSQASTADRVSIHTVSELSVPSSTELIQSEVDHYLTELPQQFWALRDVTLLREQITHQAVTVIDVRESSEFEAGHIPSALNIPLRTLPQNLSQIPRDQPVVMYCSSGYRSAMGVMALHLLGYPNVQGFPPSIQGWIASGEPLESLSEPSDDVQSSQCEN